MTSDELATLLWNAALWIEMNDTPDSGTEMQEDLIGRTGTKTKTGLGSCLPCGVVPK